MTLVNLKPPLGGYYITATERVAYLPVVMSLNEGAGAVGGLLERLKAEHDVVVVSTVMSPRLQGMLDRRDFHLETHVAHGEPVQAMVWRRLTGPQGVVSP